MPAHQHTTTLNTTPPVSLEHTMWTTPTTAAAAAANADDGDHSCSCSCTPLAFQRDERFSTLHPVETRPPPPLLSRRRDEGVFDTHHSSTLSKHTHLHPSSRVDVTRGFLTPTTLHHVETHPPLPTTQSGCVSNHIDTTRRGRPLLGESLTTQTRRGGGHPFSACLLPHRRDEEGISPSWRVSIHTDVTRRGSPLLGVSLFTQT
jgi:hypothetical protein